jgi:hypothetical protein
MQTLVTAEMCGRSKISPVLGCDSALGVRSSISRLTFVRRGAGVIPRQPLGGQPLGNLGEACAPLRDAVLARAITWRATGALMWPLPVAARRSNRATGAASIVRHSVLDPRQIIGTEGASAGYVKKRSCDHGAAES